MTASLVVLLLLIVIGLVICSGLFSGLETALFALQAHQLRRLESNHAALAGFLQKFRENPRRVLAVILLGSALVNVFLVVICLALLWETPRTTSLPPWLIALSLFAIIVFFCDLIPKLVALSAPYRLSALGVFTLRALMPLLETVGSAFESISLAVVELVTPRHIRTRQHLSDEELETLIEIGEEQGTLQEAEGDLIQEVFKLGDKTAKDVLTPRVDMFAVPDDLTNEETIAQLKSRRHRRGTGSSHLPDHTFGVGGGKRFPVYAGKDFTRAMVAAFLFSG